MLPLCYTIPLSSYTQRSFPMKNPLLSPCGLYCGVCGIHYATVHNDTALKEKLSKAYGVQPEKLHCHGCLSDTVVEFCKVCAIKSCAASKQLEGCYQCTDFPCDTINSFPFEEAKRQMLRAVSQWKTLGTEEWIKSEEKLFSCSQCGNVQFRGAKKCRDCGAMLTFPA